MSVDVDATRPAAVNNAAAPSGALGEHRPGLDGIRAVALLAVLGYHAELPSMQGGYLGLSLFFTLSGFLIAGLLLRSHLVPGGSLRQFWVRRGRRLMPAAFLALVGIVVFGATVATRQQLQGLPGDVIGAATWTANWRFVIAGKSYVNLFAAPSPAQHFWSLAIEEQFYLVLPIAMLLLVRRTRSPRVIGAVLGAAALLSSAWMLALYEHGASLDRLYYGTDTRVAELLVGAVLAVVVWHVGLDFSERERRVLAGAGVVAFTVMLWCFVNVPLADGPLWRGGFLLFSLVSCGVILGVLAGSGPLTAVMSWGPVAAIGRITYGLYLYHWPIFLWLTEQRTGLSRWPLFALRLAVTYAAAIISYRFVEQPILRGASFGLSRRARLVMAPLVAVVVVGAAFVTVHRSAYDPLATLHAPASETIPPGTGTTKVVVVPARANDPVVARLQRVVAGDHSATVTVAPPFECTGGLVDTKTGRTCANWAHSWPQLIDRVNPDVVLLYVDDWAGESLAKLSGHPTGNQTDAAAGILSPAIKMLTARGASIVWAYAGNYKTVLRTYYGPFNQAMLRLKSQRSDIQQIVGLPDPATLSPAVFQSRSATMLLSNIQLYKRVDPNSKLPRVMIVGDSQALSLGYGLDQWASDTERAVVWNRGIEGCGVVGVGHPQSFGSSDSGDQQCRAAIDAWPSQVKAFKPDLVIVLSSLADTQNRRLPGSSTFESMSTPGFDSFLVGQYEHAYDALSAGGARVVWMTPPCIGLNQTGQPVPVQASNVLALGAKVLPEFVRARPRVATFDLNGVICPDGKARTSVPGVDTLRPDGVHFSVDGSLWFARNYGDKVLRLGGA